MNLARSLSTPLPSVSSKIERRYSERCAEFLTRFATENFSFSAQQIPDLADLNLRKQKTLRAKQTVSGEFFQTPRATLEEQKPGVADFKVNQARFEGGRYSFLQRAQNNQLVVPGKSQIEVPRAEKVSKLSSQSQRDLRVRAQPEDLEEDPTPQYNRLMDRINATGELVTFGGVKEFREIADAHFENWNWVKTDTYTKAWEIFKEKADVAEKEGRHDVIKGLKNLFQFQKNSQQIQDFESKGFQEIGSIAAIDKKTKNLLSSLGFDEQTQRKIYELYCKNLSDFNVLLTRETGQFDTSKYFKSDNQELVGNSLLESADRLLTFFIEKTEDEIDDFEKKEGLVVATYPSKSIYEIKAINPYELWNKYKSHQDLKDFSSKDLRVLDKDRAFREVFARFLRFKKSSLDQKNKKQKQLKKDLIQMRLETSTFFSKQALYELNYINLTSLNLDADLSGERKVVAGILALYNPGNVGPSGILNILIDQEVRSALLSDSYMRDRDFREFYQFVFKFEKEFRANCLVPDIFPFEKDTKQDE